MKAKANSHLGRFIRTRGDGSSMTVMNSTPRIIKGFKQAKQMGKPSKYDHDVKDLVAAAVDIECVWMPLFWDLLLGQKEILQRFQKNRVVSLLLRHKLQRQ